MASKLIFVNLPVTDLSRSKAFYESLGWSINQEFTDENAACVVVDDNICLMLLTKEYYKTFTDRPIADTASTSSALYALALSGKEEVDTLVDAAVKAGGAEESNETAQAQQDEVGMYSRPFSDLDGHQWEPFWMDYPGAA